MTPAEADALSRERSPFGRGNLSAADLVHGPRSALPTAQTEGGDLLHERVTSFLFKRHPSETLTVHEIAAEFVVPARDVVRMLGPGVRNGMLHGEETDTGTQYSLGPESRKKLPAGPGQNQATDVQPKAPPPPAAPALSVLEALRVVDLLLYHLRSNNNRPLSAHDIAMLPGMPRVPSLQELHAALGPSVGQGLIKRELLEQGYVFMLGPKAPPAVPKPSDVPPAPPPPTHTYTPREGSLPWHVLNALQRCPHSNAYLVRAEACAAVGANPKNWLTQLNLAFKNKALLDIQLGPDRVVALPGFDPSLEAYRLTVLDVRDAMGDTGPARPAFTPPAPSPAEPPKCDGFTARMVDDEPPAEPEPPLEEWRAAADIGQRPVPDQLVEAFPFALWGDGTLQLEGVAPGPDGRIYLNHAQTAQIARLLGGRVHF